MIASASIAAALEPHIGPKSYEEVLKTINLATNIEMVSDWIFNCVLESFFPLIYFLSIADINFHWKYPSSLHFCN